MANDTVIDQARKARQVHEITGIDYLQDLRSQVNNLRPMIKGIGPEDE